MFLFFICFLFMHHKYYRFLHGFLLIHLIKKKGKRTKKEKKKKQSLVLLLLHSLLVKISKATTSNQLIGQVLHFFLDLKILFSFMLSKSESDKLQLGFCIGMVKSSGLFRWQWRTATTWARQRLHTFISDACCLVRHCLGGRAPSSPIMHGPPKRPSCQVTCTLLLYIIILWHD